MPAHARLPDNKITPGAELWELHGGSGVRRVKVLTPPRERKSKWSNTPAGQRDFCTVQRFDHYMQQWGTRHTAYIPWLLENPVVP